MPDESRQIILVPIFKKWGVQHFSNYQVIKIMSHTMKLWEMIDEHPLRGVINITDNQFDGMPVRSTFLIRQLMERYT
jgi:hypothetical protein